LTTSDEFKRMWPEIVEDEVEHVYDSEEGYSEGCC
jgi:hypothetical protein